MNIFDQRIEKLQAKMREDGLKAYIIPATDPHMSEECCSHFAAERFYFCPFKGSDGTLLVTLDNYYIYTDGRFWTEAEDDIKGSKCTLVYAGKAGVMSMSEFVKANDLYPLGMNESLFSYSSYLTFVKQGKEIKNISYVDMVENLPSLPEGKIWKVKESLLSTTIEERVNSILNIVKEHSADSIIIPLLDDIAYVLGYRGNDIECTPVFYSYLVISNKDGVTLFIDKNKLPEEKLSAIVKVRDYEDFISYVNEHKDDKAIIDSNRTNAFICSSFKNALFMSSPVYEMKSVKGKVEIENTIEIQKIDAIAVIKLDKYIRDNIACGNLNEYNLAKYLDNTRLENERCFDLSFPTIAAADGNASMMHYGPSEKVHSPLTLDNQLLLVDSGGQYYGGTTDTTRTFLVGKTISKEVIHDYTLTLKSQIALSTTIFEKGCSGHSLDVKAREIMWKEGLDYKCGTGHGVGYMSCVHEGPIGFRYYARPSRLDNAELVPGHIITVEPGVYKARKHGIRLENNLLVVPAFETEDGIFYKFKTITYCPYDKRGIDLTMLTDEELAWLNDYHKMVFETISPLIEDEELLSFLKSECEEIRR